MRVRFTVAAVLSGALTIAVAGCGGGGHATSASVTVNRGSGLMDAPLGLRIHGLAPRERVIVRTQATDSSGTRWTAHATFTASAQGIVDPGRESPSPDSSYRGVHGDGLLWSMRPVGGPFENVSFRLRHDGTMKVTVTASTDGRKLAERQVSRSFMGPGVTSRRLTVGRQGIDGIYFSPAPPGARRRQAVLLFGGSEGGLGPVGEAALLASHGYPALVVAYFRAPGLPQELSGIPLEYFARALQWLARQPGVAADRLVVDGVSRGSEAALLVGAHWPALVHAVIALVPSDVVLGAYPGCGGPAWTLHGRAIPYQCYDGPRALSAVSAIPVGRIRGPALLACGGSDEIWPSCPMARAIAQRRSSERTILLAYPDAGHGAGSPIPNLPIWDGGALVGNPAAANPIARQRLWPRLVRFVAELRP
jgi:dienelactone hydrolase